MRGESSLSVPFGGGGGRHSHPLWSPLQTSHLHEVLLSEQENSTLLRMAARHAEPAPNIASF